MVLVGHRLPALYRAWLVVVEFVGAGHVRNVAGLVVDDGIGLRDIGTSMGIHGGLRLRIGREGFAVDEGCIGKFHPIVSYSRISHLLDASTRH